MRLISLFTLIRIILIGIAGYLLLGTGETPSWMSESQRYALEWRSEFQSLNTPEDAIGTTKKVVARRYSDDEWVFGICPETLGIQDGGVFVVKDSTGRVRIFFGQGCASGTLADVMKDSKSLNDFYTHETWTILQFKEYEIP